MLTFNVFQDHFDSSFLLNYKQLYENYVFIYIYIYTSNMLHFKINFEY